MTDVATTAPLERAAQSTPVDWQRAHAELLRLAHERARLDADEAHWLVVALRSGAHQELGYASFGEYIQRLFGYSPRWTAEKLRVAEALESLPLLSRALAENTVSWSSVRELTRVATPETEGEWLDCAKGRTARDVERLVSGHPVGSRPDDPGDPSARRHVLRFEVSGEVLAAFREARAELVRETGGRLDDDAVLLLMARRILGGPVDVGQSSYQMALTVASAAQRARCKEAGTSWRSIEPRSTWQRATPSRSPRRRWTTPTWVRSHAPSVRFRHRLGASSTIETAGAAGSPDAVTPSTWTSTT